MSLTIQQLLNDAKRLSGRLREHDASADNVISTTQSVLKDIEAMRQYQEDIDSLNSIAHNRPRAQLVLGNILLNLKTEMTFGNLLEAYISLFISSDFSPTNLCKLYLLTHWNVLLIECLCKQTCLFKYPIIMVVLNFGFVEATKVIKYGENRVILVTLFQ